MKQLGFISHIELKVDILHMCFYRAFADKQLLRDKAVCIAFEQQRDNFALPLRQLGGVDKGFNSVLLLLGRQRL